MSLTVLSHPRTIAMACASVLVACAGNQKPAETKGTLDVSVERVMPMAESLDASAVEITLKLFNPTSKPVQVTGVSYSIDTDDVSGKLEGTADSGATVDPQQEAELKFRHSIPFPKDVDTYRAVIERSTIPVSLRGTVALGGGGSVGFERVSEVATPSLPKFVVHEAQAARYGKDGVDVTLFLRLINENVFAVMIEGVNYTVFVNDKEVKSEQAAIGIRLMAAAAEEYEVGSVLDEASYDKEALKVILSARSVTYRVTGKVELPRLTIPFEYVGEIELASGE